MQKKQQPRKPTKKLKTELFQRVHEGAQLGNESDRLALAMLVLTSEIKELRSEKAATN